MLQVFAQRRQPEIAPLSQTSNSTRLQPHHTMLSRARKVEGKLNTCARLLAGSGQSVSLTSALACGDRSIAVNGVAHVSSAVTLSAAKDVNL